MSRLLLLVLGVLLTGLQAAAAETRSVSYSIWSVVEQSVHVRFILPAAEAQHLAEPGAPTPANQTVADALADHLSVMSAGGPCPAVDQGEEIGRVYTLVPVSGFMRFEMVFQCPRPTGIVLQNSFLFDRVPEHLNFARVQIGDGDFVDRMFTSTSERIALSGASELASAGVLEYARLGVLHVVHSVNRICFVLAFLLLRSRRKDLGYLIGGVSLGYLLSLAITASETVSPRIELVEPFVGFLIVLLAAEAAARFSQRPGIVAALIGAGLLILSAATFLLARGPEASLMLAGLAGFSVCYLLIPSDFADLAALGLVPATLFGLLDGFGFAADLSMLQLPARALASMELGFDAGTVLVLTLLAAAIVAIAAFARHRGYAKWPGATDVAAAALAGAGIYWCVGLL